MDIERAKKLRGHFNSGTFIRMVAQTDQLESMLLNVPDDALQDMVQQVVRLAIAASATAVSSGEGGKLVDALFVYALFVYGCNKYLAQQKDRLEAIIEEHEQEKGGGL